LEQQAIHQMLNQMITESGMNRMLNTWKLYFVLKEVGDTLDIGDEIKIDHPGKGDYKVTKV